MTRHQPDVRTLRSRLEAQRTPFLPSRFDLAELDALPVPVQRCFRATLAPGQPLLSAVHLAHEGTFDLGGDSPRWRRFTSDQLVMTRRPGFDWLGRIALFPGVRMHVHDAYVGGIGVLHAALGGLIPVMHETGGGDLAEGELMRFLAEAAWYPTALLPSQGVAWQAVNAERADATLTDEGVAVTLRFRCDEAGQIVGVRTERRGRMVAGRAVPTPWEGRFWGHERRDGMLIPMEGEVGWIVDGAYRPYWRGRITAVRFEWTDDGSVT
jgi:hypothetical protein